MKVPLLHYVNARFTSVEHELDVRVKLLQEEIDRREEARRREIDQRISSVERAVDKAEQGMNRRLEGMNEFREAMRDQAARMMTKDAFDLAIRGEKTTADVIHKSQDARLDKIETRLSEQQGASAQKAEHRLSVSQLWAAAGVIVAVIALAVGIILATRPG